MEQGNHSFCRIRRKVIISIHSASFILSYSNVKRSQSLCLEGTSKRFKAFVGLQGKDHGLQLKLMFQEATTSQGVGAMRYK